MDYPPANLSTLDRMLSSNSSSDRGASFGCGRREEPASDSQLQSLGNSSAGDPLVQRRTQSNAEPTQISTTIRRTTVSKSDPRSESQAGCGTISLRSRESVWKSSFPQCHSRNCHLARQLSHSSVEPVCCIWRHGDAALRSAQRISTANRLLESQRKSSTDGRTLSDQERGRLGHL